MGPIAGECHTDRGDALRARGNVLYGDVAAGGGGNGAGKREKLERAQQLYKEALELTCDSEKRASCCKNLGALHYLWGKVELAMVPSWVGEEADEEEEEEDDEEWSEEEEFEGKGTDHLAGVKAHLGEAVRFIVRAHVEGARAKKAEEWMQQVESSLTGLVTWAAEQSRILALPGAPILVRLCEDLAKAGRDNLAFKAEAEALANLELAICLMHHDPRGPKQSPFISLINGLPAIVYHPLQRSQRLLDNLPRSASNVALSQRISTFESEFFDQTHHEHPVQAQFEQLFRF